MEKFLERMIRMALTSFIATGGVLTVSKVVAQMQREAKGAVKMGISYAEFNRQLVARPRLRHYVRNINENTQKPTIKTIDTTPRAR